MLIGTVNNEMQEDIQAVNEWADELYNKHFSQYFQEERDLYASLKDRTYLITDEELGWILTTLPLELFNVSEAVSQLQISLEVIKLKTKQKEADIIEKSTETSLTKKKEAAALETLEHKLLVTVYSATIERVNKEISFSRELIMSAKKIWDARRNTENSPVSPTTIEEDMPDYSPENAPKKYIR